MIIFSALQKRTVRQASRFSRRSHRSLHSFAALLSLLTPLWLALACAHAALRAPAERIDAQTLQAALSGPGEWSIDWTPEVPGWPQIILINRTPWNAEGVALADARGRNLFASAGVLSSARTPGWSLAPGEEMSFSADDPQSAQPRWRGMALWSISALVPSGESGAGAVSNAEWRAGEGLRLAPGGWAEWRFDGPLPLESASTAWRANPGAPGISAWVSFDQRAWARIPAPRQAVDWTQPLDLTPTVGGAKRFWMRIMAPDDKAVTIRQLRVERQMQGGAPDADENLFCPPLRCTLGGRAGQTPPLLVRLVLPEAPTAP